MTCEQTEAFVACQHTDNVCGTCIDAIFRDLPVLGDDEFPSSRPVQQPEHMIEEEEVAATPAPAATPDSPRAVGTATGAAPGAAGQAGTVGEEARGEAQVAAPAASEQQTLLADGAKYRLHSVVCHQGSYPASGHYTTYAHLHVARPPTAAADDDGDGETDPDGDDEDSGAGKKPCAWQWFKFDDERVEAVSAESALSQCAKMGYLVFMVNDPGPATGTNKRAGTCG